MRLRASDHCSDSRHVAAPPVPPPSPNAPPELTLGVGRWCSRPSGRRCRGPFTPSTKWFLKHHPSYRLRSVAWSISPEIDVGGASSSDLLTISAAAGAAPAGGRARGSRYAVSTPFGGTMSCYSLLYIQYTSSSYIVLDRVTVLSRTGPYMPIRYDVSDRRRAA